MFSLASKTVIVTGAGSGIGKAIALLFAKQGAHVEVLDYQAEPAQQVVAEIQAAGGSASHAVCDISKTADTTATLQGLVAKHGRIDILVNNAGIAHIGTALTTNEEDLDRVYNVNVKGLHTVTKALLPSMVEHKGGVVLNLCSIAAMMGLPDRFAYSMTKGAVLMMTYSIAKDFIADGIRCNCICPARVHTPFVDGYLAKTYPGREAEMFEKLSAAQPIGRMAKPDEIAALALYLCSDEASFVTGSAYPIDGGAVNLR
jgi:NAD(P)-dependent dehydrogenase (short-subunit alcohol dehydrogenase family)